MNKVLLKNINLIPLTTDDVVENMDVLILHGRIKKIAKDISHKNAEVIDCTDKYLLPGLIDMHVHLKDELSDLKLYLVNGITSIRNMWGTKDVLGLREKIRSRSILGPRIFTAGPIVDGDPPVWEGSLIIRTLEDAEKAVLHTKEEGYDFVKVYNNIPNDLFKLLNEVAKKNKIDVIGHLPRAVSFSEAVAYGQYGLEHAKAIKRKDLVSAAENDIWFAPTLVTSKACQIIQTEEITEKHFEDEKYQYVSKERMNQWQESIEFFKDYDFRLDRNYQEYRDDTLIYTNANGLILAGTDAPMPLVVPGFSLHDELKELVLAGHTALQALKAATINAAKCMRVSEELGTIEEGKLADLVILNKNPLSCIDNTKEIEMVITNGEVLTTKMIELLKKSIIGGKNEKNS